jgi:hypothetical protein
VDVDCSATAAEIPTPHLIQDQLTRKRQSMMAREIKKEIKFFWFERQRLTIE